MSGNVERIDRYTIRVDGKTVIANEEQEVQIRAMTAEQRKRFLKIMGPMAR